MKRSNQRRLGLLASLLLASAGITVSAAEPALSASREIVVIARQGESVLDAIKRTASEDPAFRAEAKIWAESPPANSGVARRVGSAVFTNAEAREAVAQSETVAAVPATDDPNSWPVVGIKQVDGSFWVANPMAALERYSCNPSCRLTDRVEVKTTITPTRRKTVADGSQGSPVVGIMYYFPNSGNFTGMHVDVWGITSARVMYKSSPGTVSLVAGQGRKAYAKNDTDLAGKRLTVSVQFWAKVAGNWHWDAGKTADCIGRSGADYRCFY
ncbi:MAG: hypothetical protein IPL43_11475 [Micropruina sp.]|nr:hypothetical protein [Micropruina sp.]